MASISIETKRFADLPVANNVPDNGMVLIHDGNGVKTAKVKELIAGAGAGAHNSVYRGKNLGDIVTAEQYAAIEAGTFDDMYIGDWWEIDGTRYVIAAFNYYLNTGDQRCATNHVTLVPLHALYNASMNDTATNDGAYVGSKMYTTNLYQAKTTIKNAFGSQHILTHRRYLMNAATNGVATGGAWYDSDIELMTEQNVYGGYQFTMGVGDSNAGLADYTIDNTQFPLFSLNHEIISSNAGMWLRNLTGRQTFAYVTPERQSRWRIASANCGVRPCFSIKA